MDDREKVLLLLYMLVRRRFRKQSKKKSSRRFWVRDVYLVREQRGAYNHVIQELRLSDRENHFRCVQYRNEMWIYFFRK